MASAPSRSCCSRTWRSCRCSRWCRCSRLRARRARLSMAETASSVALIAGAIAALVVAGRYLLNPFFRLLASTGAREVMTAAALLIVLGAALLMHTVGMSMALGAFLAGVLLAESTYRHELEADIEPFRGLLLALFFMGVGMTHRHEDRVGEPVARHRGRRDHHAAQGRCRLGAVPRHLRASAARRCGQARCSPARANSPSCCCRSAHRSESSAPAQGSLLSAIAAVTLLIGPPFAKLTERLLRRLPARESRRPTISTARGARCWSSASAGSARSCRNACWPRRSTSRRSTTTRR